MAPRVARALLLLLRRRDAVTHSSELRNGERRWRWRRRRGEAVVAGDLGSLVCSLRRRSREEREDWRKKMKNQGDGWKT